MAEPTSFAGPWNEVVTKPQHESGPFLGPGNNAFIFLCRVVVKGPRMSKSRQDHKTHFRFDSSR